MNNNNFSTMDAKSIINDKDFLNIYNQTNGSEYHFNILEEQQGNIVENSHTNILIRLLSYKNRFGYIFLQSFCERFFEKFTGNLNVDNIIFETESPLCSTANGNGRMDGLIYSKNNSKYDFAIIIENKINGAVAGEEQLKKYIVNVSGNNNILDSQTNNKYDRIWVVYLTREGNEKPDNKSCQFLIEKFGCAMVDDEITGDRYAALSYSDDILPWLKDEIIPMVPIADIDLYSGLKQYTDYLDRLFRDDYDQIDKFLNKKIFKDEDVYKKREILETLYNDVNTRINDVNTRIKKEEKKDDDDKYKQYNALAKSIKRINRGLIKDFIKASCEYFEENYQDGHKLFNRCYVKCGSGMDFNYIFFTDENWPKTIHFEWLSLSTKLWNENTQKYNLYFHIEDKKLRGLFTESLKNSLSEFTNVILLNKISYKKEVDLGAPILSMEYDKLKTALKEVYDKAHIRDIVKEVNEILRQNTNTYNIP